MINTIANERKDESVVRAYAVYSFFTMFGEVEESQYPEYVFESKEEAIEYIKGQDDCDFDEEHLIGRVTHNDGNEILTFHIENVWLVKSK